MKLSNWSIVGMIFGFMFSLISALRYLVNYPDIDKGLTYILIGIIIISLSWIYSKILNLSNTLTSVEDFISDNKIYKH